MSRIYYRGAKAAIVCYGKFSLECRRGAHGALDLPLLERTHGGGSVGQHIVMKEICMERFWDKYQANAHSTELICRVALNIVLCM